MQPSENKPNKDALGWVLLIITAILIIFLIEWSIEGPAVFDPPPCTCGQSWCDLHGH